MADTQASFGLSAAAIEAGGAAWTAREILQQPQVWGEIGTQIAAERAALTGFLSPLLQLPDLRIVLTGRGHLRLRWPVPSTGPDRRTRAPRRGHCDHRPGHQRGQLPDPRCPDPAGFLRALREQPREHGGGADRAGARAPLRSPGGDLQRAGGAESARPHTQECTCAGAAGGHQRPRLRDDLQLQRHAAGGGRRVRGDQRGRDSPPVSAHRGVHPGSAARCSSSWCVPGTSAWCTWAVGRSRASRARRR